MKTSCTPIHSPMRMGLAVLSGGLAFVGSASAAEIIVDGSFENTVASSSGTVKVGGVANPAAGAGWSTFSTYLYSTQYTQNPPTGFGQAFLRPYPSGLYGITRSSDNVQQRVSLTNGTTLTSSKIDAGQGTFRMAAWLPEHMAGAWHELLETAPAVSGGKPRSR